MMVGPSMPWPMVNMLAGTRYLFSSLLKMKFSIALAPRPPYSLGQVMHAQPLSALMACQRCAAAMADS
jgi:hypothetical protein